ncbi:MAG: hypothetical protein K2X81_10720, partial [Candidatus Obscuribacterales bacterium]|nr:hypothetical protein [Candidatus Obscuribacterales bacterium]
LDRLISSKRLPKSSVLVAKSLKAKLFEWLDVKDEEEKTLKSCLTYCQTDKGEITIEAAQIYYKLAELYAQEKRYNDATEAAQKSLDLLSRFEMDPPQVKELEIAPVLKFSANRESSRNAYVLLGRLAAIENKNIEAIKYFDLALSKRTNPLWQWESASRKAELLLAMGKKTEMEQFLLKFENETFEVGRNSGSIQVDGATTTLSEASNSIAALGRIGDWAVKLGRVDIAIRCYQQQCKLAELTESCPDMQEEAIRKLSWLGVQQPKHTKKPRANRFEYLA